jgi:hypothetical protein
MKLVSVSLLIEALAVQFSSPEHDAIEAFILEYAADSAFNIPLKTVLAHYDAEPDLFNPKADMPLTPGQYEALYKEDFPSNSAFNWEAVGDSEPRHFNAGLSPTGRLRKSQPELQDLPRSMCAGCGVSLPWGWTDTHCSSCQQPPKPFIDAATRGRPSALDEVKVDPCRNNKHKWFYSNNYRCQVCNKCGAFKP